MIAYDFETTRIKPGTPEPLYLTAYGADPEFSIDTEVRDYKHLLAILTTQLFTPDNYGVKFVAWHGNNFDGYILAATMLQTSDYVLRPYLTKSKALRGMRIVPKEFADAPKTGCYWEVLDGAAMLGTPGLKLEDFLNNFAPDFPKLTDAIDFEKEEFDATNKKHREYAYRDSMGLWVAMDRAQRILVDTFNEPLAVTMGGACIKIFAAHIPRETEVILPRPEVVELVRDYVMRGGYCFCVRRYQGPCWKYDLNQAYAAAMRDSPLPAGYTVSIRGRLSDDSKPYIAKISARNPTNKVPFYYRTLIDGRMKSVFGVDVIQETWLTSVEVKQLQDEGWSIKYFEAWVFSESFSMYEYVSKLETLRMSCEGGPSGPIGTMVKGVGNHSYGKTVETVDPVEFVIATQCPEGFVPYYGDSNDPVEHVFYRFLDESEQRLKPYHQPQLGAFITAYVRMQVRRAILINPDAWLYADTDCVLFSSDVTKSLDIHASKYGAWKIEESGAEVQVIAKKVYRVFTDPGKKKKRSAKGMNVKKLTDEQFDDWYKGDVPLQDQVQRNNFIKVMQGSEMFRAQLRHGTKVDK